MKGVTVPTVSPGGPVARRPGGAIAAAVVAVAALLAQIAAPAPASANASQISDVIWLCHPGLASDPCRGDLATTERTTGEPDRVVRPRGPLRNAVDCFYVYPTVSQEQTYSASMRITDSMRSMAAQQAQRFSRMCDVYAPVYRQRTLVALRTPVPPEQAAAAVAAAFEDVAQAWEQYLTHHNNGRGVVLIGHSQGTRMLRQLLRERIEPDRAALSRLISAVLIGGDVVVPRGADVGGDFRSVPLCRERGQTGCALAWSSYGQPPPATARYGVTPATPEAMPVPYGPGYEIACVNPASLARNEEATLHTLLRSDVRPGAVGLGELAPALGPTPTAGTPWLRPAQRYRAKCTHIGPAHVLMVRPEEGAPAPAPFPDPDWGLHTADLALTLGDTVDLVGAQIAAYRTREGALTASGR
ncbi:DUF3089 domain-containing protein [Nocardia farcinica]|uniref:DUF3089 domain-containing protein n=1 Tax=Nocardia farcinica TaxID=37329 RepID=UPI0024590B05|nr:DUF3089 domain-containing protein [Nocardia farcinica]